MTVENSSATGHRNGASKLRGADGLVSRICQTSFLSGHHAPVGNPLAPVGARRHSFGIRWRPLAPVGARWRSFAFVSARWRPVGTRRRSLAPVGARWRLGSAGGVVISSWPWERLGASGSVWERRGTFVSVFSIPSELLKIPSEFLLNSC